MMKVLIIPGLTLPEVSADDLERIHAAAGPDAEVRVTGMKAAHDEVADADVVFGLVPESLFARARRLFRSDKCKFQRNMRWAGGSFGVQFHS